MKTVPIDSINELFLLVGKGCPVTYRGVVTELGGMTLDEIRNALKRGQISLVVKI